MGGGPGGDFQGTECLVFFLFFAVSPHLNVLPVVESLRQTMRCFLLGFCLIGPTVRISAHGTAGRRSLSDGMGKGARMIISSHTFALTPRWHGARTQERANSSEGGVVLRLLEAGQQEATGCR